MDKTEMYDVATEYAVEEYKDGEDTHYRLVQRVVTPLEYDDDTDALTCLAKMLNEGNDMCWIEYEGKPDRLVSLCAQNGYELDSHSREEGKYILVFRRTENEQAGVRLSKGYYMFDLGNPVSWSYSDTNTMEAT